MLAVKQNQPTLHDEVQLLFEKKAPDDQHTTVEKDHGRIETRTVKVIRDLDWMDGPERERWTGLRAVVKVESIRQLRDKEQREARFYITSLQSPATEVGRRVRAHWGIESSLHWCLDIAFAEDASQVRDHNAAANLAILNKMALNILKTDTTEKVGIKAKRKTAGWNDAYLARLLISILCKD